MPIPIPREGEKEKDFTDRCMSDKVMNADYDDIEQRFAVCMSAWRKKHGGEKPKED
jgi:hypothetical protein